MKTEINRIGIGLETLLVATGACAEKKANVPKKPNIFLYFAVTIPHANLEYWVVKDEHGMEVPDYGIYASKNWPNAQKGLAAMITRLDTNIAQIRSFQTS